MQVIQGDVHVQFRYCTHFTHHLFAPENLLFREVVGADGPTRVLFVVDAEVEKHHGIVKAIEAYARRHADILTLSGAPLVLPAGEQIKNEPEHVLTIQRQVNSTGLDRHSYMAVVGGGALLDLAGFAAATAHRGIRLLRIPTTTLSQNDSGVGVKNGINAFGKKNFIGTFAPAWAVLNDLSLLETLPDREWRNGIAEAVKVALIKDEAFFRKLEGMAPALVDRDLATMGELIHRCAELHVQHICQGGDPFEMGSSRPLDFGHWSAHKLEQLTQYRLRHGEAVAIGIALDVTYSTLQGWLTEGDRRRVLDVLERVGFTLYAPELSSEELFHGLQEFREHLGGKLTIQMLRRIGQGFNVHEIDDAVMARSIQLLAEEHQATRPSVSARPVSADVVAAA